MSPFEVLYGRKCNIPITWDNLVDMIMLGNYMLKDLELMDNKVKNNLKVAQDRQKSYANLKQVHKEFEVGEHVFLKVKPKKSTLRLGSYPKLAPRYYGPF